MNKRLVLAVLSAAVLGGSSSLFAQDASPSPSPSASATPAPVCEAADAAAYSSCVAACDGAASAICASQGHLDGFIAFLSAGLDACSIPGIDSRKEYNGLKEVLQGLRQSGVLSKDAAKALRKKVDTCRKALERKHKEDEHNSKGHR